MPVFFQTEGGSIPPIEQKGFRILLGEIAAKEKKNLGEIYFIFVSNEEILRINQDFLHHFYTTDVITFNRNRKTRLQGDIYISLDTVRENAKNFKIHELLEFYRVMIHGMLHLIGYDDKTAEQRKQMRKREDYYLIRARAMKLV